jgi:hypothetical protein
MGLDPADVGRALEAVLVRVPVTDFRLAGMVSRLLPTPPDDIARLIGWLSR